MHNYVLFAIIVHFNIQKLKRKQTFIQTEKAKSSHFDRTRGDKNQIFPTLVANFLLTQENVKVKRKQVIQSKILLTSLSAYLLSDLY